jgi:two-component system phosphate regulon sensor histidine kinase PhoR
MTKKSSSAAADLVHELQTPLSVLRAQLEAGLAESWCHGPCEKLLQQCLEDVNRLNQYVVDILLLEKADSGQLVADRSRCDVAELVSSITHQMKPLALSRDIKLTAHVDGPVEVEANEGQLTRVLSNLVENAVKYTPDRGQVSIEVVVRGELAEIRVRDSGCGIPTDAVDLIFERFYRVEEAQSPEIAGAGLGLTIAKALAQANDATIEVESTVGKGSCFTLKLPALGESPP